ncbi:helix-turn-helix domain-containing protein [Brevibacillus laterosporus]|uniref:helix-turn-helix domain-containing protein n=1 Tax=Brevibacillus laterosporus TaxID=1465 RepID=UPI0018CF2485|nr:helix-turn-helix transcriptional regulator [Brevibacillus laterosporus]MBG9789326.1 DNA-binding protein [Brevibacillus laterosporus]
MSESLTFTTLGELIKEKRIEMGISLSELGRMTGISKGVLSKIENDETKRPELRTIKPLVDTLKLPYENIVELYVEIGQRFDVLCELILEAIELRNTKLVSAIVLKLLESPHEDTHKSLERLYKVANSIVNTEMKIAIFTPVIAYARERGIPLYIAKGLYQKYLIEREDLKRLEESFRMGEEITYYVDFLSHEEQLVYYYRMTLHAYNIKKYEKCIEMGKKGFKIDQTIHELKQRAAYVVINSYILLNEFAHAEEFLYVSEKSNHNFIIERSKFIRANIYFGKGEYNVAIPILQECLSEATEDTRVHIMNDLLESYINLDDMNSVQKFLEAEEDSLCFNVKTPHKHRELGRFFKLKGIWQVKIGKYDCAIQSYLRSIHSYEQISANEDINQCIGEIFSLHFELQQSIELNLLEKLVNVYNAINKPIKGKVVI